MRSRCIYTSLISSKHVPIAKTRSHRFWWEWNLSKHVPVALAPNRRWELVLTNCIETKSDGNVSEIFFDATPQAFWCCPLELNQKQGSGASTEASRCACQFLWYFFVYTAQPVAPGPLKRVLEPPKAVISRVKPKTRLWGINVIVSMVPSFFFSFSALQVTPGPLQRVLEPPKMVISGVTQKQGCWDINGIV